MKIRKRITIKSKSRIRTLFQQILATLVVRIFPLLYPTALRLTPENRLLIDWSDGQRRSYTVRGLRDACPCATCREKRSQPADPFALPVLKNVQTQPLTITAMEPVGNYAYSIRFSDGHDTGIFAFDLLRQLGEAA